MTTLWMNSAKALQIECLTHIFGCKHSNRVPFWAFYDPTLQTPCRAFYLSVRPIYIYIYWPLQWFDDYTSLARYVVIVMLITLFIIMYIILLYCYIVSEIVLTF